MLYRLSTALTQWVSSNARSRAESSPSPWFPQQRNAGRGNRLIATARHVDNHPMSIDDGIADFSIKPTLTGVQVTLRPFVKGT